MDFVYVVLPLISGLKQYIRADAFQVDSREVADDDENTADMTSVITTIQNIFVW